MKSKKNNVMSWTVLSTLFVFTGYILTFIMNILISRHTSVARFGDFSIALRVLGVVCILIVMGTDNAAKRFLSKYVQSGDEVKAQQYIRWNLKFLSRSFIICLTLALLMLTLMVAFHFLGIHALDNHHLGVYVLFVTPLFALIMLLSAFMASYGAYVIASIYDKVFYALIAVLYLLIFIFLIDNTLDTTQIFWFLMLVSCLVLFTQIVMVLCRLPALYQSVIIAAKSMKNNMQEVFPSEWMKSAVWMFSGSFVIAIAGMTDLLILEFIHVSEEVVGHFAAASNIALLLVLVSTGTSYVLSARVSTLKGKDQSKSTDTSKALQKESNLVTWLNLSIGSIFFGVLIIFGHQLLNLYGPSYSDVYLQLIWIALAYYVATVFGAANTVLLFSGNEHITFYIDFSEYICRLVLGVILTIMYGLNGLVAATVVCIIAKFLVMGYFVRRCARIKPLIII